MEYNEESIFNMALAYLKRIDRLLYFCDLNSMNGDIYKWNNILMIIFRELSIRLTEEEKKEIEGNDCNVIDSNKNDVLDSHKVNIINNLNSTHATFKNINFLINNKVYCIKYKKHILFLLHEIEMKIRRKMQDKGMLLPSKDDPRRAITRR